MPRCDQMGCNATPNYACRCRRCCAEPDETERYFTCAEHVDEVTRRHDHVRGRVPVWFSAALTSPAEPALPERLYGVRLRAQATAVALYKVHAADPEEAARQAKKHARTAPWTFRELDDDWIVVDGVEVLK